MTLNTIFDELSVKLHLESKTKDEAFIELIEAIVSAHPDFDINSILGAVKDREQKMGTAIGSGAAIPHGYYQGTRRVVGAIGISQTGIDYDAPDDKPVHLVFMLIIGQPAQEEHLRVLNQVFSLVKSDAPSLIQQAKNPREVHEILARFR